MNSLKDLLQNKADDIDSSGIKSDLELIQKELERYFSEGIHARQLKSGVVYIEASSSSLASNLRMKQHSLIEDLNSSLKNKLLRFSIRIT